MPIEELGEHPAGSLLVGSFGWVERNVRGELCNQGGNFLLALVKFFGRRAIANLRPWNCLAAVHQFLAFTFEPFAQGGCGIAVFGVIAFERQFEFVGNVVCAAEFEPMLHVSHRRARF